MKPKVAVVIPVYNAESTVLDAIASVDQQSYRDLAIIAVDDGSTDNSLALLRDFAMSRPNVVVLTHGNHGAGYSRNRGIRHAMEREIPFIAFLDADDIWHQDKIAWQMRVFELHPDADLVAVKQERFERRQEMQERQFNEALLMKVENLFEILCLKDFPFHPASCVARTSVFSEELMYDTRFSCGEDFRPFLYFGFLWLTVFYIDVALYFERALPGSLQRQRCSAYHGYRARVVAIDEMLGARGSDTRMTPPRVSLLLRARGRYLSGMIYGARRCLSYPKALAVAARTFTHYRQRRKFLVEFTKTVLFPLTRSLR